MLLHGTGLDGWYGGDPGTLGVWLDDMHRQKPELCIGISEYGAGASVYHQQDSLLQPVPVGMVASGKLADLLSPG